VENFVGRGGDGGDLLEVRGVEKCVERGFGRNGVLSFRRFDFEVSV
jgi:hypothetical protein